MMELGIYTFADVQPDKQSGNAKNAHKRMQELLEEVKLTSKHHSSWTLG